MSNRIVTQWRSIPSNVAIVAVTKSFPFAAVSMAYAMGLRHMGENRIEEAEEKIRLASEAGMTDIIWHMIGHVQSRKVFKVASLFDRVDSVDSVQLLRKLDNAAEKIGKTLHVLLEVNVSREGSKYGFQAVPPGLAYTNLHIDGLMTMAPLVHNPEKNRAVYRTLKTLAYASGFGKTLSMGTSIDYQVAIEEGATEVRLGEALFGPRG